MPIIPFSQLMIGYMFFKKVKKNPKSYRKLILFSIILESTVMLFLNNYHNTDWMAMKDIINSNETSHSIYTLSRFNFAYYSWGHVQDPANRIKLYAGDKDPTYARLAHNVPIPILHDID
jgi:hypothetical protein